ncbi:MAG: hypothetical protein AT715_05495 [Thermoproteus sp. JCHS_4]|jgi:hypothetical protein|nr:MAG: hypothetical protein AT715_05495 [Thermoproteus sp. JCHS_4]
MPKRKAPDNLVGETISRILDRCGVAGPMRATYHGFGRKIWSIAQKHGDQSSINDAIAQYQTHYGANPEILKIITESLLKLNYT